MSMSMLFKHMCSLGFYNAWIAQGVWNEKVFLHQIKQRLSDQFTQNWHNRLANSSRASFYSHIANFRFQPYLDVLKSVKLCSALTRLRVSSHRLMIETGRWQKPTSIPIKETL